MTVPVVSEKPKSRPLSVGSQNDHTRECIIAGAATESAALTAMLNETALFPVTYAATVNGVASTFIRDMATVEPITDGQPSPTMWDGRVKYVLIGQSAQPYVTGQNSRTFKIGTESVNMKQSLHTWNSYIPGGGAAPDMHGLIGVDPKEHTVAGVNVDVPTFVWSETWYVDDADMTDAYIHDLYTAVKSPVFDQPFRGFDAYETKILGVQGTQRHNGGDWELSFDFAASPNETAAKLGGITDIVKGGWDYVWGTYGPDTYTSGGLIFPTMKVTAAYVEQVYHTSDPALLDIGT
jgi:hypothetical protein